MRKYLIFPIFLSMIFPAMALADSPKEQTANPETVLQTKMVLRDMWVEHVFWIRSYVYAVNAGDDALREVAEQEVVANAKGLAASIKPFYGEEASDGLFKLLAGHWGAVKSYSSATFDGSESMKQKATQDLTDNAREIAKFLSGANPYLPEDAVFGLLAAHGAHHVKQIDEVEASKYADEAKTWAQMRKHMFVISDAITDALAKQFPEKF